VEIFHLERMAIYLYLWGMKTTLDLPDEMLHQAKIIAAQRKTTLKELVIQGLLHVTQTVPDQAGQKRREAMQRLIAGLQAQNTEAMVPLTRGEAHDR